MVVQATGQVTYGLYFSVKFIREQPDLSKTASLYQLFLTFFFPIISLYKLISSQNELLGLF
jgi:hypothetical protein